MRGASHAPRWVQGWWEAGAHLWDRYQWGAQTSEKPCLVSPSLRATAQVLAQLYPSISTGLGSRLCSERGYAAV